MKKKRVTRCILGVGCGVLALIYLFPIFILFLNSFKTQKGIYISAIALPDHATFTLQNYPESMRKLEYVSAFLNSVGVTLVACAFIVILSAMAAWALVRNKTRASKGVFLLFAASMLIPFQCVMLPLVKVMGSLNLMNRPGLIFMYVGFGSSLSVVMFHGFVKGIPMELEESAMIDGCGLMRRFFSIVLPLLKPIFVSVAVLNVMWLWNDFLLPSLVINQAGRQTLPLRTYQFFGQFSKRWDLASAALILAMIPIIIFYILAQKQIVKGITDGAIK